MKCKFYNIKTGKTEEMWFEDVLKGVPIGWMPVYGISMNTGKSRIFEETIIYETEGVQKL